MTRNNVEKLTSLSGNGLGHFEVYWFSVNVAMRRREAWCCRRMEMYKKEALQGAGQETWRHRTALQRGSPCVAVACIEVFPRFLFCFYKKLG